MHRLSISVIWTVLNVSLTFFYVQAYADMSDYKPDCNFDRGPCIKIINNAEVTFDINPKPVKTMEELSFTVNLKGIDPEKLIVSLDMPGMYMGENRVLLKESSNGKFTGKGVIPGCSTGGKLWRATIEIPGKGKVHFSFNVQQ